jgi:chromosome segregation ATPase
VDEIKKLQEELDKYGPQENPKELNNMQSQLKEMDMSIASLQEKRDHYQQKLNKLQ